MPPRRNVKKGDRRMDAALDAMRPYGFDLKVVRLVIRELLKVYEGEWSFMEEYSYKLLIETIIERQENEARNLLEGPDGAGTSTMRELVVSDVPEPLSAIPLIGPLEQNNGGSNQPRLEGSTHLAESRRYPRRNRRSGYAERVRNILGVTRSQNTGNDSPCKRRFCYGYLGEEGEEDNLIEVEPQPDSSASLPISLLLSHFNQNQSTNPGPRRTPGYPPITQHERKINSHPN